MKYEFFNLLTEDARFIREKVFVEEQGFQDEFDETDSISLHLVLYIDEQPAATGRMFQDVNQNEFIIGRIAVLPEFRNNHLGAKIVELLELKIRELGGVKNSLSAQCRAKEFYEKLGYYAVGDVYLDEYCEHIHMEKFLNL